MALALQDGDKGYCDEEHKSHRSEPVGECHGCSAEQRALSDEYQPHRKHDEEDEGHLAQRGCRLAVVGRVEYVYNKRDECRALVGEGLCGGIEHRRGEAFHYSITDEQRLYRLRQPQRQFHGVDGTKVPDEFKIVELCWGGVGAALTERFGGCGYIPLAVGVGCIATDEDKSHLHEQEGKNNQFTIAILHTTPLLPSALAVCTIYTPDATRLPFVSHPSQVNMPPLERPSATSAPLEAHIFTSAL